MPLLGQLDAVLEFNTDSNFVYHFSDLLSQCDMLLAWPRVAISEHT